MTHMEDECLLMDNTAAASLFSPTLWLGSGRTKVQRRAPEAYDAQPAQQQGRQQEEEQQQQQQPHDSQGSDSPGLDGMDTEMESMEQLREDLQRLAALEEMYTKLKLQNAVLERQLKGIYAAVNGVLEENRCMKRLISLLQVRRGDFIPDGRPQQEAQQGQAGAGAQPQEQHPPQPDRRFLEEVGRRLIGNLHQQHPGLPAEQQQQQQAHQQLQGGQPAAVAAAAVVDRAAVPATPKGKAMLAALGEEDSPRIPAYPGGQQQQQGAYLSPHGEAPEDVQIAAAALATTWGDASAALATLLDHAMAARQ